MQVDDIRTRHQVAEPRLRRPEQFYRAAAAKDEDGYRWGLPTGTHVAILCLVASDIRVCANLFQACGHLAQSKSGAARLGAH